MAKKAAKKATRKPREIQTVSDFPPEETPATEQPKIKKSAAVREFIAAGLTTIPEIQKAVMDKYGLDVKYQNIYVLLKKPADGGASSNGGRASKAKPQFAMSGEVSGIAAFGLALQFVKSVGGLSQAYAILEAVEQARDLK